jgi:YD repeat-containing protein
LLQRATPLTTLIALLFQPTALHAELQVANGFQDSVFTNWINDHADVLFGAGPVSIGRQTCAVGGQPIWAPFAYRDYPGDIIVGCAYNVADATTQVLAKVDAHLRKIAVSSRTDLFYALRYSTLVVLQNSDTAAVYGRVRIAPSATDRNTPDDVPPGDCSDTSRPLAGDPIVVATGQSFQVAADYQSPRSNGLSFQRFHDSANSTEGILGVGWRHGFSRRIEAFPSDDASTQVQVIRDSGKRVRFVAANGEWKADATEPSTLETLPDGWRYRSAANELETYDAQGLLLSVTSASGDTTRVTRDSAGRVATVEDASGRSLALGYDADGRLSWLQDVAGATTHYAYVRTNGVSTLSRVTDAAGATQAYLHELSRFPGALTGLQDQNGARHASWSFDDSGRATSSERAGGVDRTVLAYATGSTTVTDALGATRALGYQTLGGVAFLSSASQPAGSGCSAATRRWLHDSAGNLVEKDDFNQARVCFAYDDRHRQIRRVEGLGTSHSCAVMLAEGAVLPATTRKFSRQWHPDWRFEIRRAEPGRIVTRIYNGQPDPFNGQAPARCAPADALLPDGKPIAVLCKQVVQSSTDGDGHVGFNAASSSEPDRVTRWTYNALGQVLTATEQGSSGETTNTYVYYADTTADHTQGDLQRITTAAGDVTQFTAYNRHGQVLQRIAPDGSVTNNTYDAMQRLLSTTADGEAVSFTYDAVGQLIRIGDGDGGWVGYAYDDAHRRTAAFNHLGHRIDHRLDAAGHVTRRTVNDPDGALTRQLARSIDLLGRVQQQVERP